MDRDRLRAVSAALLCLTIFSTMWSTALYLFLGLSLDRLRPWSVYKFIHSYGLDGAAGAALGRTIWIGLGSAVATGMGLYLTRRPHYFGDARWAYPREIRAAGLRATSGILLGRQGRRFLRTNEPGHTLVTAPTRSGKGVGVVIPNLLSWPDSVVVLDIKHENFDITSGFRAAYGQSVFKWSPLDEGARSHRFNPLDAVRRDPAYRVSDLQRLGRILLPNVHGSDPMWQDEARDLFLGLSLYVLATPSVPSTIGEVYRTLKTDADLADVFEHLLEHRRDELDPACVMALSNFMHKAPKERSGVKSNLTASLHLWANPVIDSATSVSDFDLTDLRRQPISIYVGVTMNQLKLLAPLLNLFFQQTVDVLSRQRPGPDEPHEVLLLIDEFASLGRMEVIASAMAFLAGYNVRLMNIIQGLGQLHELYGQGMETILQNCRVQSFFASNDDVTTNYVSRRLGTTTIRTQSRSDSGSSPWASRTRAYTRREMLLPEEVRQFDEKHEIIFVENARPIRARKIRYFEDPAFKERLLGAASVPSLSVEAIPARTFELTDAGRRSEEPAKRKESRRRERDTAHMHRGDAADAAELTAMAVELEKLLVDEARTTGNPNAIAAANELRASIGPPERRDSDIDTAVGDR